jgi:hypothetical protein
VSDDPDSAVSALRHLNEDLVQTVRLPPVDRVVARAAGMNRANTAATAAVLTVGALGAVTVIAQSALSGGVPLPAAEAFAPALTSPAMSRPGSPLAARILEPNQRLIRLKPGTPTPSGASPTVQGLLAVPDDDHINPADELPWSAPKFENGDDRSQNRDNPDRHRHGDRAEGEGARPNRLPGGRLIPSEKQHSDPPRGNGSPRPSGGHGGGGQGGGHSGGGHSGSGHSGSGHSGSGHTSGGHSGGGHSGGGHSSGGHSGGGHGGGGHGGGGGGHGGGGHR